MGKIMRAGYKSLFRLIFCFFGALLLTVSLSNTAAAKTWYKVDSHNFVIYSDDSKSRTEKFAHDLEKFDAVLRMAFKIKPEEPANRLTIFMVSKASYVDKLASKKRGNIAGFYVPRTEGSFAVTNRERSSTYGLDGQTTLFHEYAHHFMFRNFHSPVPAWFSEGFAEYVATAEFKRDGSWTFGNLAYHRAYALQGLSPIKIEDLLAKSGNSKGVDASAFYAWSWALTHMLYRDKNRRQQLGEYIKALKNESDPLKAAEQAFGDLDTLESDLRKYIKGKISYLKSDQPIAYNSNIRLTVLDDYQSELAELTMKERVGYKPESTRDALRNLVQSPAANAEAWYELAKAEYAIAHDEENEAEMDFSLAEAAVDKALSLAPDHLYANILKGDIIREPLDHSDNPPAGLSKQAQKYYMRANRADSSHPLPLYRLAKMFMRQGKNVDNIGEALSQAFLMAPESQELRAGLSQYYASEGRYDAAILVLEAVGGNPHSGDWARERVAELKALRDANAGGQMKVKAKSKAGSGSKTGVAAKPKTKPERGDAPQPASPNI